MSESGVDGNFGGGADSPGTEDQNRRHSRLLCQRSRSIGDWKLEESGEGSGYRPSQLRHGQIWTGSPTVGPDTPNAASGSGLISGVGPTQAKSSADEIFFQGSDDGYEGRYERLWRRGQRHYLRSRVKNDPGSEGPSVSGNNSLENRAEQFNTHHTQRGNHEKPSKLRGTDGRDTSNSHAGRSSQSQGTTGTDSSEGLQATSEQIWTPQATQGKSFQNTSSHSWPDEEEIDVKRQDHWHNTFARLHGIEPKDSEGLSTSVEIKKPKRFLPFAFLRRPPSRISRNLEDLTIRRNFLLKLAKALLYFGAPPHRIESQLVAADAILNTKAEIVYLPNIVIVTMQGNEPEEAARTYFVRSKGRIALTSLHRVHMIYRDVLHDRMGPQEGIDELRKILRAPPIYPLKFRCFLAFVCSSIICVLAFGGSAVDMFISGICASVLQYLGLSAANKSSMYANVYEISVSIFVAFVARGLSSIPGHIFCYSAISSAGVVLILPGFTVLISSLELMSKNIFCGSVRIVYAIIYTLFLGFGLTIGSDFYLVLDRRARRQYAHGSLATNLTYTHGQFVFSNSTSPLNMVSGVIGTVIHPTHSSNSTMDLKVIKGCLRDDSWSWWRQPFPWYAVFVLVPLYSICSSLSNLQSWRSIQLPVMVVFSCAAYAANKATSILLPGRTDIVSAAGAFVIGLLGNIYSRVVRGTAFTSMVTGVLFLVPSGIAQGGGLNQTYHSASEQYSVGFSLALRMISLASGVTVGLFVSQVLVYLFGSRKNGAHFAF